MISNKSLRLTLTAVVALVSIESLAADRYANFSDNTGSLYSMRLGNWGPINKVLEQRAGDVDVAMGFAAKYRIVDDLEKSTSFAKQCYDHEITKPDKPALVTAYFCGTIMAGNRWLLGDTAGWATINSQVRDWAYPKLRALSNVPDAKLHDLEADFDHMKRWPSVSVHEMNAKSISVPIHWKIPLALAHVQGAHVLPHVTVTVNGHALDMLLDTGSSMSFVNADQAKELGIVDTVTNFNQGQGAIGTLSDISVGLVSTMGVGGEELRNVPFAIGSNPFSILGMAELSRFGAIRVNHDSLDILSDVDAKKISCDQALTISSIPQGLGFNLVMPISRGGEQTIAWVDTGNSAYFEGVEAPGVTESSKLKSDTNHTFNGADISEYYDAASELRLGTKSTTITFPIRIDKAHFYLQSSIVGAGALKDVSIFVNFRGRRACFL